MSVIFNSADIAETMNNGVSNVTGADSTITENYSNVVQHGIKIDMSVSEKTISGTPPLTFNSNGTPLIDYTIYGNSIQDGTPTPTSPVAVNGVGTLSSGNYIIPISTNGVININLNSVPTTRKIKKLVLTGDENWSITSNNRLRIGLSEQLRSIEPICSHYKGSTATAWGNLLDKSITVSIAGYLAIYDTTYDNTADFKSYLAQQYANGTPVTVWYVLIEPTTSTVNEPLMKIGDYADSVSYSQAGVTIPTASGNNTLDVQTTPKPSNISITYKGR